MKSVVAMGEAIVDFIPEKKGEKLKNTESFKRVCGGAPANVAAAVARLGGKSRLITQLGKDAFGEYIKDELLECGVDTGCIMYTDKANTPLAFVSLDKSGEREFAFYRKPSSDMLLSGEQIKEEWFSDCAIFHFGSVDLLEAPVKYAHKAAIRYAKKAGAKISFDPNIRLSLWDCKENCVSAVWEFIPYVDILKISDDELEIICNTKEIEKAKEMFFEKGVSIILYTKGADGLTVFTREYTVSLEGVKVEVCDTTGAGDACMGAFLFEMARRGFSLDYDTLLKCSELANFYSAYSVTGKGAVQSYASYDTISGFIEKEKR